MIFDIHSWHYKLILWSFGKHFFDEAEVDWKAVENMKGDDLNNISWQGLPKKYHTKTVNLCPYCRALVGATLTAPLLYVYRLFPHKKNTEPMTKIQAKKNARRRTWISLGVGSGINIFFGLWRLVDGELLGAFIQITIGTVMITGIYWGQYVMKAIIKLSELIPKRKRTYKVKAPKPKKEHKILQKIAEKHDVICPPIFFIDKTKEEELI